MRVFLFSVVFIVFYSSVQALASSVFWKFTCGLLFPSLFQWFLGWVFFQWCHSSCSCFIYHWPQPISSWYWIVVVFFSTWNQNQVLFNCWMKLKTTRSGFGFMNFHTSCSLVFLYLWVPGVAIIILLLHATLPPGLK